MGDRKVPHPGPPSVPHLDLRKRLKKGGGRVGDRSPTPSRYFSTRVDSLVPFSYYMYNPSILTVNVGRKNLRFAMGDRGPPPPKPRFRRSEGGTMGDHGGPKPTFSQVKVGDTSPLTRSNRK